MKKRHAVSMALAMWTAFSMWVFAEEPLAAPSGAYLDLNAIPSGTVHTVDQPIWGYGDDTLEIHLAVPEGAKLRAAVNAGDISVLLKRVREPLAPMQSAHTMGESGMVAATDLPAQDLYLLRVKTMAGPRDTDPQSWTVELDSAGSYYLMRGTHAYSDVRAVESGSRYTLTPTTRTALPGSSGSVFAFEDVLEEETRIVVDPLVDVFFQGDYGRDTENLRMQTGSTDGVDYFSFLASPKFNHPVRVRIDGANDALLYAYDQKTEALQPVPGYTYTSNGFLFESEALGTYLLLSAESAAALGVL